MLEKKTNNQIQKTPEWQKYAFVLLRRWYFIIAGLIIGFSVGYIKNRYATDIYNISAQLISKKGDSDNDLSMGKRGGLRFKKTKDTRREIATLLSQKNLLSAISKVDFSVSYFITGDIRTTEIYPDKPFFVQFDSSALNVPYGVFFTLENDGENYRISSENEQWKHRLSEKMVPFGQPFSLGGFEICIKANPSYRFNENDKYSFRLNNLRSTALSYKNKIRIFWKDASSALVDISCKSTVPEKDLDFLNAFFTTLVANNLEEKYESSKNAIRFLDAQAERLRDTLFYIDTKIDRIRLKNKRAVKGTESIFMELDSLEYIDAELEFENQYYDFLKEYVDSTKPEDVFAPNMIGVGDELLNGFMKQYIDLKFESRLYKNDKNIANPLIKLEDRKAKRLEENIFENIANLKFKNDQKRQDISRRISHLHQQVPGLQLISNEVKELIRFSRLYENLLSIMQEKKLEADLAIAQTTSDYDIVEPAKLNPTPIAPDKQKNLLTWLFFGVLFPVGIIAGLTYLNPKVIDKDDITNILDLPLLATIWHNKSDSKVIVLEHSRSMIAESFRSLKAKLKYYLDPKNEAHIIVVTSSLSGEGKSFTSVNLASMYAYAGQKTVLIGADLRKPSLSQYFSGDLRKGLSNYLVGDESYESIIQSTEIENYSIIHAGEIPPNPFELLSSQRMKELVERLKGEFDKIIIDTPPVLLVSDTLPLSEMADISLLLVRNNVSLKPSLKSIAELQQNEQFQKLALVYNDVDPEKNSYRLKTGYGYKYGGGYYVEDN